MGSDVFWKVIQEAFHDADWRVRFEAVERVTGTLQKGVLKH